MRDTLLHMSADRREVDEIGPRGFDDGFAGRPDASDHPTYTAYFQIGTLKRRVVNCEAIMCAAEGVGCTVCGHDSPDTLAECACAPGVARHVRGMFVIYGFDSLTETADFRPMTWIRALMADGTPVVLANGEDASHRVAPFQ